jgi:flagellar protein FliL
MADEDLDLDVDTGGEAPKKSKKLLFIIIAVVLVIIIGAVGGMFAMGLFDSAPEEQTTEEGVDAGGDSGKKAKKKAKKKGEEEEELANDSIYWAIEPPFVMNFEGKSKAKYMQIGIVVMSRSQIAVDMLKKHAPAVRNELTFLLGSQKFVEMNTPEGKEQLRSEIIESINNIIKQHGASAGIKNVLFTSFVMQ